jgi:hypothetical protein
MTYLIGLLVDKIGKKEVLNLGALIGFLTWIVRMVIKMPLAIIGVDGFYRVSEQMIQIPLNVLSYQKAIDGGTGQALYFREISLCLGSITALILALVIIWLNFPLKTVFLLASFGVLTPLFIGRK